MKKLLVIVILSFLLSGNSYAGCKQDVELTWHKSTKNKYTYFKFKNNGSKHVRINKIRVKDIDGEIIHEYKVRMAILDNGEIVRSGFFVSPYGERTSTNGNRHVLKYGKKAGWTCTYQKPYEKTAGDRAEEITDSISDTISNWFDKDKDD